MNVDNLIESLGYVAVVVCVTVLVALGHSDLTSLLVALAGVWLGRGVRGILNPRGPLAPSDLAKTVGAAVQGAVAAAAASAPSSSAPASSPPSPPPPIAPG